MSEGNAVVAGGLTATVAIGVAYGFFPDHRPAAALGLVCVVGAVFIYRMTRE